MRAYVSCLVFALATALLIPISTAAQYIATELPPLPGDEQSVAYGISASGEIVGVSHSGGDLTAVVWDRDGNPSALPFPLDDCMGTEAWGINSSGMIIGQTVGCVGDKPRHPVVWDSRGNPSLLPSPLRLGTAMDINASGLVIGTERIGYRAYGILWDRDGNRTELVGNLKIFVSAINAAGKILGVSVGRLPPPLGGFPTLVWDRHGNIRELAEPACYGDISDSGEIVGRLDRSLMVCDQEGNIIRVLPPLPGLERSGWRWLQKTAGTINARGEVVGRSWSDFWLGTATVWDSDGNPTALPDSGPDDRSSYATGINAAGEIVGNFDRGPAGFRAVVWRPDRRRAP
jgi:uncharacterized membrane protein